MSQFHENHYIEECLYTIMLSIYNVLMFPKSGNKYTFIYLFILLSFQKAYLLQIAFFTVTAIWNKKTYFRTIWIFLLSIGISNSGICKKICEFLSPTNWNCFVWQKLQRVL